MYQKKLESDLRSPLEFGLEVFSGKWHSRIICELSNVYPLRFGQLKSLLSGITDTALAEALKKLVSAGIVSRFEHGEKPVRVEYALTEMGWSVIPIFESICLWSSRYYRPRGDQSLQKCQQCKKCLISDVRRPSVLPVKPADWHAYESGSSGPAE